MKWNMGAIKGCATYTVTTQGGTTGIIKFAAKAATNVSYGLIQGPVCR